MSAPRPYTLIAELTYRCPLRCAYCSNPVEWAAIGDELSTQEWLRVLGEARALGVVQVHFSGGEPLLREDLAALVARARALDLYTNLVTTGAGGAFGRRLGELRAAGLDHVQLSVQELPATDAKIASARQVRATGLPLTINVVLHRDNIDQLDAIVALAERVDAQRLELANAQYLGWALVNRDALLPAESQIAHAREAARAARERLRGRMELVFVLPDHHADRPRACMDGWARRFVVVAPDGLVLPCHAARSIATLRFEGVRERGLDVVWREGEALGRYRGHAWMPEPCRSCAERDVDHGGCRCQAFHLTGDASAADPACALAPRHALIESARASASAPPPLLIPRARLAQRR